MTALAPSPHTAPSVLGPARGSGSFLGMDPGTVRECARSAHTIAQQVRLMHVRLSALVDGAAWVGADAEALRAHWWGPARDRTDLLADLLAAAAHELDAQAAAQDAASAPGLWDSGQWAVAVASSASLAELRGKTDQPQFLADLPGASPAAGGKSPGHSREPEVRVTAVRPVGESSATATARAPGEAAPQDLAELILSGDEARRDMFAPDSPLHGYDAAVSTQVRIQRLRTADGRETAIVYLPPTQGAPMFAAWPWEEDWAKTWGDQGNPTNWGANDDALLRSEGSSIAAARAAMAAEGPDGSPLIPPGAQVMLVGHSQGGIVGARLVEDPALNNRSGAPGTYDITTAVSIGSPVQMAVPAQASTQVLNISHVASAEWSPEEGLRTAPSDVVPWGDMGGRVAHPTLGPPENVTDVALPTPVPEHYRPRTLHDHLGVAHDSVLRLPDGRIDPTGGYYGTVLQYQDTDPALRALTAQSQGTYLGPGVTVVKDVAVEVQRA